MRALILNSGMGSRMGAITNEHPKCMTVISEGETILSRQLKLLSKCGIKELIMTTGPFDKVLIDYCNSLNLSLNYTFINNPVYDKSNYIYSIYLARDYLDDDILMMHGDLVFEYKVLQDVLNSINSCMTVSSTLSLPPKDFKAVMEKESIKKIGVEFFENALAAQPLYKINRADWDVWLKKIIEYCNDGQVSCYAENAFNEVSDRCHIYPIDYTDSLCAEIDTPEDLNNIKQRL